MATYVTKRCPHCGYAYQILKSGDQRKYGCPLQICARCSNHYWDKDIVEPALHGFENFYETRQSAKRVIAIVFCTPMALLFLAAGIFMLIYGEIIGLVLLAIGGGILWIIGCHIKEKIYEKRNRKDIVRRQQSEYDMSMKRLKDTEYLAALANFDKRAKRLLDERKNGKTEYYAIRPY